MDVVNGKIVSARSERADLWSALKPSSSRVSENPFLQGASKAGADVRAREWAPSWASSSPGGSLSPPHSWGGACAPGHGGPTAAAVEHSGMGRWTRRASPETVLKKTPAQHFHDAHYGAQSPAAVDRQGWKRSSAGVVCHQHHNITPCSVMVFDEEMSMYESQLTRTVSSHFAAQQASVPEGLGLSVNPGLSPRAGGEGLGNSCPATDTNSKGAPGGKTCEPGRETQASGAAMSSDLKRQRVGVSDPDQDDCGWVQPLKFLIRKGLSVSDVGELGRIVLSKKDAEGQLPQIDTKEGKLLEMEDYSTPKHWLFRYKWWINNKSRMYILENTGEFIKYHNLKEHDSFVVYEDGCGKLVVQAQKKTASLDNSWVDPLKENTIDESITAAEVNPSRSKSCGNVIPTTLALVTLS